MLNEIQIGEVWTLFADYIDKKQIEDVAERYVTLLVDHDVSETVLQHALGVDAILDHAINTYIEDNVEDDDDDYHDDGDF